MIRYACTRCGALLESPTSLVGQQDRCPVCGQVCTVPETPAGASSPPPPKPPPPFAPRPSTTPAALATPVGRYPLAKRKKIIFIAIPAGILLCIGISVILGLVLAKGKTLKLEFGKEYTHRIKDREGRLLTTLVLEFQEPVRSNLSVIGGPFGSFSQTDTYRIVIKVTNLGPREYVYRGLIDLDEIEIKNERGHLDTARCNYRLFEVFPPRDEEDLELELGSLGGRRIMPEQEAYEVIEVVMKPGFVLPEHLTGTICGTRYSLLLSPPAGRKFLLPLGVARQEEGPAKESLCGRFRNFSDSDRRNIYNHTLTLYPNGSYRDVGQGLVNDMVTVGEWVLEGRRITLSPASGGGQRPGYVVSEYLIWMHGGFFRKVGSGSGGG